MKGIGVAQIGAGDFYTTVLWYYHTIDYALHQLDTLYYIDHHVYQRVSIEEDNLILKNLQKYLATVFVLDHHDYEQNIPVKS